MSTSVHHVALAVADLEASLRFYRDGLGFVVVMDEHVERDWQRLLGSPCTRIHIVVLVSPDEPTACPIELVAFEDDVERPRPPGPPIGLSHLSLLGDVHSARDRLRPLGYTDSDFQADEAEVAGQKFDLLFFRDPDGVMIELGTPATAP